MTRRPHGSTRSGRPPRRARRTSRMRRRPRGSPRSGRTSPRVVGVSRAALRRGSPASRSTRIQRPPSRLRGGCASATLGSTRSRRRPRRPRATRRSTSGARAAPAGRGTDPRAPFVGGSTTARTWPTSRARRRRACLRGSASFGSSRFVVGVSSRDDRSLAFSALTRLCARRSLSLSRCADPRA